MTRLTQFWVGGCLLVAASVLASASQLRVQRISGPAGSLFVDDGGAGGTPVIFVHAFAGSSGQWSAQLAHLRTSRRAIALDLRGQGQSAAPGNHDYRVDSLAKDVLRVADALALKSFVLVGHSLGGAVAASVVNAQPDRVAGLVLVATPGKVPPDQAAEILARIEGDYDLVVKEYWTKLLEGAQPNVRARVHNDMARVSKDAALEMIGATFEFDPLPGLLKYQGPKLAIITAGEASPTALHKVVPDLPHVVIEGTSHWPQMDKPVEFNRVLDEFLSRIK